MKEIKLTRGKYAIVDDDAFEELNKYKWYLSSIGYAVRNLPRKNGIQKKEYLHRNILKCENDEIVDHIDRNKLNNLTSNLRKSNYSENRFNSKISKNNTSGVTGLHFNKNLKKWEVRIGKKYLGRYENKSSAIKVRNDSLNNL